MSLLNFICQVFGICKLMEFARNILRNPIEFIRLWEGYPRNFLADPWISQGVSLGSLLIFISLVRDTLGISLGIHGACKEYP